MKKNTLDMCREIVDEKNRARARIFPVIPPAVGPVNNRSIEYTDEGPRMKLGGELPPRPANGHPAESCKVARKQGRTARKPAPLRTNTTGGSRS